MKKLLLIAIVCLMFGTSCSSNQSKAEQLVKTYLEKELDDPKSYESVSFSELKKMKDTIFKVDTSAQMDTVKYQGKYEIEHTYRAKNALGAILTKSEIFQLDSALTRANCCFVGQHVAKSR